MSEMIPALCNRAVRAARRQITKEAAWLSRPAHHWQLEADRRTWIFVTGCNRSGKTLFSNLLHHDPRTGIIPNANSLTRAVPDSAGEGCPHVWTEKLHLFRRTDQSDFSCAPRLIFDWLWSVPRHAQLVVVESDLAAAQMRWLQNVFTDSHFIGLVRNGYAVAQAIRLKERYDIARCARHWRIATEIMLSDANTVSNYVTIFYEEFVARRSSVIERLGVDLQLDIKLLRSALSSGWRLGNTDHRESHLYDGNPELIAALSSADLEAIDAVAADLLARLGYRRPPGASPCGSSTAGC